MNKKWHESTGKIVYDPYRGRMKKKTKWWCVLEVDKEITRYYRWWVQKEKWLHLYQPSWDAHVSIIRGEKPRNAKLMKLWKKYDGLEVKFKYKHEVRFTGDTTNGYRLDFYCFVDVDSPELINIRKELLLPCDWNLHMTIGRTY